MMYFRNVTVGDSQGEECWALPTVQESVFGTMLKLCKRGEIAE